MNLHSPSTARLDTEPRLCGSPLKLLLPYQNRWVEDDSRFKFGLMARQVGKDFSAGAEGVRDCFDAERRGRKITWLIVAPSERQSLESFHKWKEWTETFQLAIHDLVEERENPRNSESRLKASTIVFPGGSRVIAVPGRPDTVRGFSANVLLTEALFFDDFAATWRAILPSITNPLRGGDKKCRLISTPNGIGTPGHELWTKHYDPNSRGAHAPLPTPRRDPPSASGRTRWSCHRVTIYEAADDGLPVNVQELRDALNDPDGWAQEFELEFMDQSTVLLPYNVIDACENSLATESVADDFWSGPSHSEPLVCGIDFGRKRDLTVCWTLSVLGGAYHMTREVLCLKDLPTDRQVEHLRPRLRCARRACLDYTGPGIGLGDFLVKEFGEYNPAQNKFGRIELVTFTNDRKCELFSKLRMAFDRRLVGIPIDRAIREDLHSLQRVALPGGGVTFRVMHGQDSHADRATALALAHCAADADIGTFGVAAFRTPARIPRRRKPQGIFA